MSGSSLMTSSDSYWQKFLGIELYKVRYYSQWFLYKFFRIKLPKLGDQRDYWKDRGNVYMEEILKSGYLDREVFFQDMLVDQLKQLDFGSFFEAGSGFGWNVRRVQEEFPGVRVGGLDFSFSQLVNSKDYLKGFHVPVANGDNCCMPLVNDAFDVGFSLGVFMNIHTEKIRAALSEMVRVCGKYIIHLEYDEERTTSELREKRAFKTNIVSHSYAKLYEEMGQEVIVLKTFKDFGEAYKDHAKEVMSDLDRWEGFEGAEKYIFIVVKVNK